MPSRNMTSLPYILVCFASFGIFTSCNSLSINAKYLTHYNQRHRLTTALCSSLDSHTDLAQLSNEYKLRFAGVGRLHANNMHNNKKKQPADTDAYLKVLKHLHDSTVAVIGLGGVGSWAAEALCRSGIGNMILMDLDDICISNTNRQIHAVSSNIGKLKTDAMRDRLLQINPECNITLVHDFVTADNVHSVLDGMAHVNLVLDAIDGSTEKSMLIDACVSRKIPIVTCGGAAGRVDPTKVVSGDLVYVSEDRLLRTCKRMLRKYHGFPNGLPYHEMKRDPSRVKKWGITAIYSLEKQKDLPGDGSAENNDRVSALRRCDGALGTACYVTGAFAFVAAARVVEILLSPSTKYKARVKVRPVTSTSIPAAAATSNMMTTTTTTTVATEDRQ
jgi:tRNA threonylcarbamoyladenosine dehydratase